MRWSPSVLALVSVVVLGTVAFGCEPTVRPWVPRFEPAPVHSKESIRRVCVQAGLGRPGALGGSIVFESGVEPDGVGFDTVYTEPLVAPSSRSLCTVPEQPMRICPGDSGPVVVRDGVKGTALSVGTMARGYPIGFYDYVSADGLTKAVINYAGNARFIPADEICHLPGVPQVSRATTRFQMNTSVPAGPKAFRPRSTTTIRRIVIHNTEIPLAETLHHFGREDANTSAHVVIDRDGTMYRVVEDQYTAFHAGASKDHLGGHNATSLGIEVVAFDDPKYGEPGAAAFFSDAQREAVINLVDFWMNEYGLTIAPEILSNHSSVSGYADLEYGYAAVTIHRLTKADRGTNCPRLLFPDSPDGDEAFFRWREATFSEEARQRRASNY
jgi:N-acetyl-anhydromuramyl-L-alanine amidase AmpD